MKQHIRMFFRNATPSRTITQDIKKSFSEIKRALAAQGFAAGKIYETSWNLSCHFKNKAEEVMVSDDQAECNVRLSRKNILSALLKKTLRLTPTKKKHWKRSWVPSETEVLQNLKNKKYSIVKNIFMELASQKSTDKYGLPYSTYAIHGNHVLSYLLQMELRFRRIVANQLARIGFLKERRETYPFGEEVLEGKTKRQITWRIMTPYEIEHEKAKKYKKIYNIYQEAMALKNEQHFLLNCPHKDKGIDK
jgi:hypothetical protein